MEGIMGESRIGMEIEAAIARAIAEATKPFVQKVAGLEESLRGLHDRISRLEDCYAELAPGASNGGSVGRFIGKTRVDPADGRAMRKALLDGTETGEAISRKWKSKYTERQIASVLAHASGKHRLRSKDHER
jgi:hypothetical protein